MRSSREAQFKWFIRASAVRFRRRRTGARSCWSIFRTSQFGAKQLGRVIPISVVVRSSATAVQYIDLLIKRTVVRRGTTSRRATFFLAPRAQAVLAAHRRIRARHPAASTSAPPRCSRRSFGVSKRGRPPVDRAPSTLHALSRFGLTPTPRRGRSLHTLTDCSRVQQTMAPAHSSLWLRPDYTSPPATFSPRSSRSATMRSLSCSVELAPRERVRWGCLESLPVHSHARRSGSVSLPSLGDNPKSIGWLLSAGAGAASLEYLRCYMTFLACSEGGLAVADGDVMVLGAGCHSRWALLCAFCSLSRRPFAVPHARVGIVVGVLATLAIAVVNIRGPGPMPRAFRENPFGWRTVPPCGDVLALSVRPSCLPLSLSRQHLRIA